MTLAERIAKWLRGTACLHYELRSQNELLDEWRIEEPVEGIAADNLAEEILVATQDHVEDATRTFQLVGIDENGREKPCSARIRRAPEKGNAGETVVALTKQVTDLHRLLLKERAESHQMALTFARELLADRTRIVAENEKLQARQGEVLDRLEKLRAEALEQDMAREKHKRALETQERIADALLPLGMSIGAKLLGVDSRAAIVSEICRALKPDQLPLIQSVTGEHWPTLAVQIEGAIGGHADVPAFLDAVNRLSDEQRAGVIALLNPGQTVALQELLSAS